MRPADALWSVLQRDERGVTSIEYALLGALIAMVIVSAVTTLGTQVRSLYELVVSVVPLMP
ncbi:Flp/Fap pilin protein [Cupriavidus taiwanensis]|uniref:Flp family type IVb pilin n=1 Tax=Cupriavidus taiwanensis TaxID=164546 RepID=UPI000E12BFB4|nr:Flp family type IVb pilin [Cupriavidus taiwanensis]SOZ15391.1 Flp/Fap pilin protein [Cupriavidus taiwanensis]SOZ27635.1 Flp/Fap pilin protein [Cupriavidus taiwanensis]SOZ45962.1 Flp/Fap pilin protein [Cupriavidus taiwanensis]